MKVELSFNIIYVYTINSLVISTKQNKTKQNRSTLTLFYINFCEKELSRLSTITQLILCLRILVNASNVVAILMVELMKTINTIPVWFMFSITLVRQNM